MGGALLRYSVIGRAEWEVAELSGQYKGSIPTVFKKTVGIGASFLDSHIPYTHGLLKTVSIE